MFQASLGSWFAVATLAATTSAQCPNWVSGGGLPGMDNVVRTLHSFDDGSGSAIYAGGPFTVAGTAVSTTGPLGVVRWTGSDWLPVGTPPLGDVVVIAGADSGTGPRLHCATTELPASTGIVRRFDGASWVQLGVPFGSYVTGLTSFQGQLYAAGNFTTASGLPASRVARWNGLTWESVAGGVDGLVDCMTVFNDGGGEKLIVGGAFSNAGGVPAQRVAAFDGTTWAALPSFSTGRFRALAVHDDGGGAQLYASTSRPGSPGLEFHVVRLDPGAWTSVGQFNAQAWALTSADDGGGRALVAAGDFTQRLLAGGGSVPANGIAQWRAGAWSELPGLGAGSNAVAEHVLPGGARRLIAATTITAPGGADARHVAQWNGTTWSATAAGGNVSHPTIVVDLERFDSGSGATTYSCDGLGHLRRWSGTSWSSVLGQPGGCQNLASGTVAGMTRLFVITQWPDVLHFDGTTWDLVPGLGGLSLSTTALAVLDDGAGSALFASGSMTINDGPLGVHAARWNGTSWTNLGTANFSIWAFEAFDDGSGLDLYCGGSFSTIGGTTTGSVARWNGTSWSALPGPQIAGLVTTLRVHDDGSGPRLFAGGVFSAPIMANVLAWNRTQWSAVGAGLDAQVEDLEVFDDGAGAALYAAGHFANSGATPVSRVARWDGTAWSPLGSGVNLRAYALASTADRASGAPELMVGGEFQAAGGFATQHVGRWRGCSFDVFCAGDGVDPNVVACPCANFGGAGRGCANSLFANGAELVASGAPIASQDTLTLTTNGVTGTFALFFQGDQFEGNGTGALLGDGVRCVGGSLRRLGTRAASSGVATHGFASGSSIASIGLIPATGGPAYYQAWYRNASSFCTSDTFNLTNGVRVLWMP